MRKKAKSPSLVGFLLLIAAGLVAGSHPLTGESSDASQDGRLVPPTTLEGLIEPWEDLSIGVGVEGVVVEVYVKRGQAVKKGDLIARLESSVEEAQYELALATSEMRTALEGAQVRERIAGIRAERHRELYEDGAVTREELEQALSEHELGVIGVQDAENSLLRAALDAKVMKAILDRRTVKSPVDGIIVEKFLSPGELVNRAGSGDVVRIAQVDPLKIDIIAPLELFGEIKPGRRALVYPEAPIGGTHEATVTVVDPIVDAASGTFRIRLELPNEDLRVPSGVRCRVQFQE